MKIVPVSRRSLLKLSAAAFGPDISTALARAFGL